MARGGPRSESPFTEGARELIRKPRPLAVIRNRPLNSVALLASLYITALHFQPHCVQFTSVQFKNSRTVPDVVVVERSVGQPGRSTWESRHIWNPVGVKLVKQKSDVTIPMCFTAPPLQRTALSDQAQPCPYILHGAYYMTDRDSGP